MQSYLRLRFLGIFFCLIHFVHGFLDQGQSLTFPGIQDRYNDFLSRATVDPPSPPPPPLAQSREGQIGLAQLQHQEEQGGYTLLFGSQITDFDNSPVQQPGEFNKFTQTTSSGSPLLAPTYSSTIQQQNLLSASENDEDFKQTVSQAIKVGQLYRD
eukprot:TRINITY_DN17343_c0_g1_i1.p1 TRINITY_DN17343_c0_g1~~TRINITY_DN17343_c0_g1_i1.p1  ORF type:complete len:156 (+),score=22.29 TRINITY_DN17343_c0_g1_i1:167-634(+)